MTDPEYQIIQETTSNPWYVTVTYSYDGFHNYVAYFTGGPFDNFFINPAPNVTELIAGSVQSIDWQSDPGVMSSCSLMVEYTTNGSTWHTIAGPIPWDYGGPELPKEAVASPDGLMPTAHISWQVPSVTSNNCYLRLRSWDLAGNQDTTISHQFGIACYQPIAAFPIVSSAA